MGDHLALLVDHLLTESTLDAAIGSRKMARAVATNSASSEISCHELILKRNTGEITSTAKMVECRICQEEDEASNMEIPCSCCGSLKYAHRKCVQRWCNEKGDTICEICLQEFKTGYTSPPERLSPYGSIAMNFRGSWDVSRQDIHNSQLMTMFSSDRGEPDSDYDFSLTSMRSTLCCRSIAIIFLVLLTLRHTLPLFIDGAEEYSFTLFSLLFLKTAGILLPFVLMVRACAILQQRNHQRRAQEAIAISVSSYGETAEPRSYLHSSQPHLIQIH